MAPTTLEDVPAGHTSQIVAPAAEYVPASHSTDCPAIRLSLLQDHATSYPDAITLPSEVNLSVTLPLDDKV